MPSRPLPVTSDGDDTLNNVRVPSLERDELEDEDVEAAEREPLLIPEDVVIEMAQHER